MLPRFWKRQLAKLVGGVLALTGMVLFMDFYFNFVPSTIYHHLPLIALADEVVIDIKIETCIALTGCLRLEKDGWYRLPKNIYLGSIWGKSGYVYAKRVKHESMKPEDQVLLDVAVGSDIPLLVLNETGLSLQEAQEQLKAAKQLVTTTGIKGHWTNKDILWLKHGGAEKHTTKQSITAVDVLFGKDAVEPRPGWALRPGFLDPKAKSQPQLSLRTGVSGEIKKPELKFRSNNKFKILQAADFHFSTGVGECLDPFPLDSVKEPCEADPRTLELFTQVLDQEKPDLVVFTGDQIFGDTAPDSLSAMFKAYKPVIDRKIPYAIVFGNHDHQGSMTREEMMSVVEKLPYSMSQAGDEKVDGVGNYLLTVAGAKSNHPALSIYLFDSHDMAPKTGYDNLHDNQVAHIKTLHDGIKEGQKEYSHIPLSMAFFHIPLPEHAEAGHTMVGQAKEGCTAPHYNRGAKKVLAEVGVSVVSVGHDHVNDYCMFHEKKGEDEPAIWLCYGGGSGEGAYGGYGGWIRRFRLFEIDAETGDITTWKLVRDALNQPLDKQLLVKNGEALLMQA